MRYIITRTNLTPAEYDDPANIQVYWVNGYREERHIVHSDTVERDVEIRIGNIVHLREGYFKVVNKILVLGDSGEIESAILHVKPVEHDSPWSWVFKTKGW